MKDCKYCGHAHTPGSNVCPACGKFYTKIAELIAEEEAEEERRSFQGRVKRIFQSDDIKVAVKLEFKQVISGLSGKAKFTLFVIFVFVFALIVTVI
ncbi:MAG: hypothetical protein ABL919_05675 [Methylococcales bacterium]|nr:zinc ribbon domain-containing protein [Methylococcaceae bacterium]